MISQLASEVKDMRGLHSDVSSFDEPSETMYKYIKENWKRLLIYTRVKNIMINIG